MKKLLLWDKSAYGKALQQQLTQTTLVTSVNTLLSEIKAQEFDAILMLVELPFDWDDQPTKRQNLSGIQIARELRLQVQQLLTPITFVSFLSLKEIVEGHLDRDIMRAVGHYFVRLPFGPAKLKVLLKKNRSMTDLELADIRANVCRPDDIANAQLHQLPGIVLELKDHNAALIRSRLRDFLLQMHRAFSAAPRQALAKFDESFENISPDNIKKAITAIIKVTNDLIEIYRHRQTGVTNGSSAPIRRWQLLLLDDELNEDSPLVQMLKDEKGVTAVCTVTAKDAMKKLTQDNAYRGKFMVILTDYRLNELNKDGVSVQQNSQGYTFLNDVAAGRRSLMISAVVYSGMPRQFLFETARSLRLRTEFYSKKDFALDDSRALNHLADRIVELGDENYKALLALPLNVQGWKEMQPFYQDYRNLPNYEDIERNVVCRECTEWLAAYESGIFLPSPKVPGEYITDSKKKISEKHKAERFLSFYKTRRLAHYLNLKLRPQLEKDPNFSEDLIRREISRLLNPAYQEKTSDKGVSRFFSQSLGISLTEFPSSCTIEELNWLQYDHGIPVLDKHKIFQESLRAAEQSFAAFISSSAGLNKALKLTGFQYKISAEVLLHFDDKLYLPFLSDKSDIGKVFRWIEDNWDALSENDYTELFTLFNTLKRTLLKNEQEPAYDYLELIIFLHEARSIIHFKKTLNPWYKWHLGGFSGKDIAAAMIAFRDHTAHAPVNKKLASQKKISDLAEFAQGLFPGLHPSDFSLEQWWELRKAFSRHKNEETHRNIVTISLDADSEKKEESPKSKPELRSQESEDDIGTPIMNSLLDALDIIYKGSWLKLRGVPYRDETRYKAMIADENEKDSKNAVAVMETIRDCLTKYVLDINIIIGNYVDKKNQSRHYFTIDFAFKD